MPTRVGFYNMELYDYSDSGLRTVNNQCEQQCPDCGEWYKRSHSDEWDAEAQKEHESFCVAALDEWEPDYELLRQEREIDGEV